MSTYVVTDRSDAYEVGTRDGEIIAACCCGSGLNLRDKGLGRAMVAAWKTQHQDCPPRA